MRKWFFLKSTGFTLIELLITISIIGVVFGIVLTSANAIQKQARDGQRQSDLRSIQSALQQYYADAKFYPALSSSLAIGSPITSSSGRGGTLPSPVKTYLNKTPGDPLSGTYTYTKSPANCDNNPAGANINCTNYCISTNLENTPSPIVISPPCVSTGSNDLYLTQP